MHYFLFNDIKYCVDVSKMFKGFSQLVFYSETFEGAS